MNLIPIPHQIPAHWGYFQALLMLTFPLHLLFMNAMVGSAGIAFFQHFSKNRNAEQLSITIAKSLPFVVAFTVNLGVAPLLFLQVLYGHFIYTSSVLMGSFWILGVPFLLIIYALVYLYDFHFKILGKRRIWPLAIAVLLLLVIGFFFTNNMTLMLSPGNWSAWFDNMAGTIINTADPSLIPRYLHLMTAALAVGGLYVAILGYFKKRKDPALSKYAINLGMKWFTHLTMLQIVIGFWFLMSLPKETMMLFMGGSPLASALLLIALVFLVLVIMGGFRQKILLTSVSLVILVYLMAFIRDLVRDGYLGKLFDPASLQLVPQYSPLVLFVVTLLVGLVAVYWMLQKTWQVMR